VKMIVGGGEMEVSYGGLWSFLWWLKVEGGGGSDECSCLRWLWRLLKLLAMVEVS
jgi:hypothetical protein